MVIYGVAILIVASVGLGAYLLWDKIVALLSPYTEPYREALERAGVRMRSEDISFRILAIAIIAWGLLVYFMHPVPWVAVVMLPVLLAVTFYAFGLWVKNRINSRLGRFNAQLEVALRLMSTGLRVGLGLRQALIVVVSEMPDPIRTEFNRVLGQTSIGVSIYDALDSMGQRMPGSEMLMLTRAIRIQSQTGGNLSKVLDTLAETIKQRRKIDRKVMALTSEARLSSYIVTALPIGVGLYVIGSQPDMRDALLGTTFGRLVILAVLAFLGVGQFVMRAMSTVEV